MTSERALKEVYRHEKTILEKSGMNRTEFEMLLKNILKKVRIYKHGRIDKHYNHAKNIMDRIDTSDTPFIAVALATHSDGIWSDDKHFKEQSAVKVWTTEELVKQLL